MSRDTCAHRSQVRRSAAQRQLADGCWDEGEHHRHTEGRLRAGQERQRPVHRGAPHGRRQAHVPQGCAGAGRGGATEGGGTQDSTRRRSAARGCRRQASRLAPHCQCTPPLQTLPPPPEQPEVRRSAHPPGWRPCATGCSQRWTRTPPAACPPARCVPPRQCSPRSAVERRRGRAAARALAGSTWGDWGPAGGRVQPPACRQRRTRPAQRSAAPLTITMEGRK